MKDAIACFFLPPLTIDFFTCDFKMNVVLRRELKEILIKQPEHPTEETKRTDIITST
jgi:hypothetical protein